LGTVLSDGTNRYLPGAPNIGHEAGGAWVNALTNQQGSVLGHADASGLVGGLTHYDPYGSPLPGESGLGTGPGFSGEWTDATGLVNLRFRAYDPSLQSFFARDSFGGVASAPLTANRYAYALGNPLRFTDPSGHFVAEFQRNPGLWTSAALQFVPFFGDAYSLATGLIGFDPIAGIELSGTDRALAMAGGLALGGGFHLLGHVDDVARAENRADALGDAARGFVPAHGGTRGIGDLRAGRGFEADGLGRAGQPAASGDARLAVERASRRRVPPHSVSPQLRDLGTTDAFGNITVRSGLPPDVLNTTLRHESVHRFFSVRYGPFKDARASLLNAAKQTLGYAESP
jgi:RHS repeat-associated protein